MFQIQPKYFLRFTGITCIIVKFLPFYPSQKATMIHENSRVICLALIVWSGSTEGVTGLSIRPPPSAQFLPSPTDRVINLRNKKENFDEIQRNKELFDRFSRLGTIGLNIKGNSELESKLRLLLASSDDDQNSVYIQKVLDLMFQDMEKKSRPRYG